MEYVNEFSIDGKVIAVKNGQFPALRLISKSGKKETFPLVHCSQAMIDESKVRVNSHVMVEGYVEIIFVKAPKGGYQKRQIFKATKVERATTLCEKKFGESGKFFDEPSTSVYLKGTFISQKIRDDGWASMMIQVSDDSKDTVKVNIKSNPKSKKLQKNDTICVVGSISTANKTFGDDKRHFENIIVNDIAVEKAG